MQLHIMTRQWWCMIKLAYINSIVYLRLNQNAAAFYKTMEKKKKKT